MPSKRTWSQLRQLQSASLALFAKQAARSAWTKPAKQLKRGESRATFLTFSFAMTLGLNLCNSSAEAARLRARGIMAKELPFRSSHTNNDSEECAAGATGECSQSLAGGSTKLKTINKCVLAMVKRRGLLRGITIVWLSHQMKIVESEPASVRPSASNPIGNIFCSIANSFIIFNYDNCLGFWHGAWERCEQPARKSLRESCSSRAY